jgi:hypothetical protein
MDGGGSRVFSRWIEEKSEGGCAFILDDGGSCGGGRKQNSSYCDHHHALCHIAEGSVRERRRLRETEALANAVGGRRGKPARIPPDRFLRRLENATRVLARPDCSCIVPKGDK